MTLREYIDKAISIQIVDFTLKADTNESLEKAIDYILFNNYDLHSLKVTGGIITDLPENIYRLTSLRKLAVTGTAINFISDKICGLVNLEILELNSNKLSDLPDKIGDLKFLKTINLNNNNFTKIPYALHKNVSLTDVSVINNQIRHLSTPSLKNIHDDGLFSKIILQEDYDRIVDTPIFSNIKSINARNNHLISLANLNSKFPNIEEINVSRNQIQYLTEDANDIGSLKILRLNTSKLQNRDDHALKALPENIGEARKLEIIELTGNSLKKLPQSFFNLENLLYLDISLNNFTDIPEEIGNLENLKTFKCYSRIFGSTPQLMSLPNSIGNLNMLEELIVSKNSIKTLPDSVGNLKQLKVLDLTNNSISHLPESLTKLENLETLKLKDNPLEDLPSSLVNLSKLKFFEYDITYLDEISLFKYYGLAQISRMIQIKEKEKIKIGLLKLPDLLKTAFQRYFVAFDDFWKDITDQDIHFKVNKHPEGLEIEVETTIDITKEDVEERLNQYFSLITIKKDDLPEYIHSLVNEKKNLNEKVIRAEVRVSQLEQDLRIVELQNKQLADQARNLLSQFRGTNNTIIHLEAQNNLLKELKNEFINVISLAVIPNTINVSQNQEVIQSVKNNIHIDVNISDIQDDFLNLLDRIPINLKDSGEQIQNDLDNKSNIKEISEDNSFKTKFRRFFKDLSKLENVKKLLENINSVSETIPKAYDNTKKSLQTLLDFSNKLSMSEAAEYIKSIIENFQNS